MSETSEPQPKNRVWYKLTGKSEHAIKRAIAVSQSGEVLSDTEKNELAEILGLKSPVAQYGKDEQGNVFAYAVFPETFGHPFSQNKDEFYMLCPIGRTKAAEQTHFTPADGVELSEAEVDTLERILFMPWGGSVPIVSREPISLQTAPAPQPSGPSGP